MNECLHDDQLARAAEPGTAEHAHAEGCPRCRARVLALREFLREAPPPIGLRPAEARERILAAVRGELAPRVTPLPVAPKRRIPARTQWLALAAAAVVVAGGALLLARAPSPPAPPLERGATDAPVTAEPEIAGGRARFQWAPVAGADAYVVRVLGAGLDVIHESAATADTTLEMPLDRAALGVPPDQPLYWQVLARRGDEPLEETAPRLLRLR